MMSLKWPRTACKNGLNDDSLIKPPCRCAAIVNLYSLDSEVSNMRNLKTLTQVPLRTVWRNESQDFTPWLAENLTALGEALGMELEHEAVEAPVGGFSLDILATDLNRNRPVVIENQLSATDHDHLGKILTYAAGFDASAVVWVAESLREEHRQALDWLNQHTDGELDFYGVVIEVLKIGDSEPAYNFRVVVFPNEWRKDRVRRRITPRGEAYLQFFQGLIDRLREKHGFTRARVAQTANWYDFASGYSGINYQFAFAQGARATVAVRVQSRDAEWNLRVFDELLDRRERVEEAYGESLEWDPMEGNQSCSIIHSRPGSIEDDQKTLADIKDWAVHQLLELKRAFDPHLEEILRGT